MGIAGGKLTVADRVAATKADVPVGVALARQGEELGMVDADRRVEAIAVPVGATRDAGRGVRAPTAAARTGGAVDVRVVENRLVKVRTDGKRAELSALLLIPRTDTGQHRYTQILIVAGDADREVSVGGCLRPGWTGVCQHRAGAQEDPFPMPVPLRQPAIEL